MGHWLYGAIVVSGRLPLFCFFCGFVLSFLGIRVSVRLIRAQVRWWPRNTRAGNLHIHHMVYGVVCMIVGGVAGLAVPDNLLAARAGLATLFGVGAALTLDEFALILHLQDVYWSRAGRTSVDAVFAAIALTGLILLGLTPVGFAGLGEPGEVVPAPLRWLAGVAYPIVNLGFVVISLLKGKLWTGLLGIFVPGPAVVGAVRLSRPDAPWARWRYAGRPRRQARARRREVRLRQPMIRAKIAFQELLSGKHDADDGPRYR